MLAATAGAQEEQTAQTSHQITIEGRTLKYTAITGRLPIRDSETGEVRASIFFVAYTVDSAKPRPLTFAWNGGPGSSSFCGANSQDMRVTNQKTPRGRADVIATIFDRSCSTRRIWCMPARAAERLGTPPRHSSGAWDKDGTGTRRKRLRPIRGLTPFTVWNPIRRRRCRKTRLWWDRETDRPGWPSRGCGEP